ncbi:hypothetical protein FOXB_04585, partial [Fusarium oxysporum f. sp. conglutinans Fo5176]
LKLNNNFNYLLLSYYYLIARSKRQLKLEAS